MANSLDSKYKSSGFSISRIELISMQQPMFREYFVSDGSTTSYSLSRHVDTELTNTLIIRAKVDQTGQILLLDNLEGDNSFSNGGQFYYTPPSPAVRESFDGVGDLTQAFSGDGTITNFTVTNFTPSTTDQVSIDGSLQTHGTDYTIGGVSNNEITFNTAPSVGSTINVRKLGTTIFTVVSTISDPRDLEIYVDGSLLQINNDYLVNGQNITFYNTPSTGTDNIIIIVPSVAPYGSITLNNASIPNPNDRLILDYFTKTQYYSNYEDGVLKQLAMDLTLHPYANHYTYDWSDSKMKNGTIVVSYASNQTNSSVNVKITGTDAVFSSDDLQKRIIQEYGRGEVRIESISNDGTIAFGTILTPFTQDENNLEPDMISGVRYAANSWRMSIPEEEIEQQSFNIIYPYSSPDANSYPVIDENGQQNQSDVMNCIRRIGSRFIVESEKGVDILSSKKDIIPSGITVPTDLVASSAWLEGRAPQKWRLMFEYNEQKDEINVFAGTKYQISDNGTLSSTQGRDGIKGPTFRRPGELCDIFYDSSDGFRKSRSGWFRRAGKDDPLITPTYPVKYRLTVTDHGLGLFMWDHASVDQDDDYAWFVIQRHVNNTSGKIELEEGKSPIHCVYSPSKRAVEASNTNIALYQNWSKTVNSITGQVNLQYDQLGDIYDIDGRQLKSTDRVVSSIITDKDRIFATTTGTTFGNFNNYLVANTNLSEVGSLTSPGFTVGTDYITAAHVSDFPTIATTKDPTISSQAPDIAYLGVDYTELVNFNTAYQWGLGPAGQGLEIESIYLARWHSEYKFQDYVELERGVHWELEVQAIDNFTNTFRGETYPVKRFGIKFLHPVENPVNNSLRQLVIHEINDTDTDWSYDPLNTSGGTIARQKPKVLVNYRWKGAGYQNRYINPVGRSGDGTGPLENTSLLSVYVSNVEINAAVAPEEYIVDSDGVPQFTQIPVFGNEQNVYAYMLQTDHLYVRDEIANSQVVTIAYENYAIDPNATSQYLIELPSDPDIPASWMNPHNESKAIYRFCIREQDVLKPWDKHVSAIIPQVDSPAIINPYEQLALTDRKTLVTFFPTPMTSQRYIYPEDEMDLICYTSADASTMGGFVNVGANNAKYDLDSVQSSSVTGDTAGTGTNSSEELNFRFPYTWHTGTNSATTSSERTYLGMHSTLPYGNGMRIMLLVRGGSIRPEYSDFIPPDVS